MTSINFKCKRYQQVLFKITIILIFLNVPFILNAAFEKKEVGAVSISMGNATVAIFQFKSALYQNPAALAANRDFMLMLSYQNFYGFSGINEIDVIVNCRPFGHPFSFAVNRLGNQLYQEVQLTMGSRITVGSSLHIGCSVQLYFLKISEYGQAMSCGLNLAFLYRFSNSLSIGTLVTNVNHPVIGQTKEKLPQTMSVGICYCSNEKAAVSVEIFRDIRYQPEYRAGFLYYLLESVVFRAGIEDGLQSYAGGIGLNISRFEFDYAVKIHQILGVSHIISLTLCL